MWRRRRRKKYKFFVGCLILLLIGFVYGYVKNDIQLLDHIRNKDHKQIRIGEIILNPPSDTDNKTPKNVQQKKEMLVI
ncbi:hypothetical protein FQB35_06545 [Crassaminicella thermophila]|uniref:Uncharacterized protein n=1 Tax=Crassaminicella thermophila TaxID=2599308 RepID=A0A5C0SFL8_CRATE|nr:hypothetical protein [Crassaminicella thermophila]QEK12058.1 hypothetical protein FQB35_06545 [Crassaminicella thermophila]